MTIVFMISNIMSLSLSISCATDVETNWNLPLWEQINLARQNIYDGTWTKVPSQGWMFVPLVQCEFCAQRDTTHGPRVKKQILSTRWF